MSVLAGPDLDAPVDLSRMLSAGVEAQPDGDAVVSAEGRMTWSELDDAATRLADSLRSLGLSPGDRVASLMPNRIALIVHYLACVRAGLVAVPLNYRYVVKQIDHALEVSGASLLLVHDERRAEVETSQRIQDLPLGWVWYGVDEARSFENLVADGSPDANFPGQDPDSPAFIFFTSGSTGPSKGVTHSLASAGWMIAAAAAAFEMTPEDVFLPGSSMSHLGSFLWALGTLSVGAKVVVARTFDGDELLPLIRAHRPTILAMLPSALNALIRDHGAGPDDFESFRVVRCGSDHVPAELEHEFEHLFHFPIDEGYGMSEIGLASLNPPSGRIVSGSIGVPVAGMEMSIRDDKGNQVAAEVVGRLWMRAQSATVGYWDRPEATAALFEDGWLDSGDLVRADEDGYLWFFGRKKQIIVHDGSNISPQEVEDALADHPAVRNVGVVGVHDDIHGETVRAYVSLAEGTDRPSTQDLIRHARERVGYRAPEEIIVLPEIPLNPTGKVDRAELTRMANDHIRPDRPG